jgi:hypothetical protein
MKGKMYSEKSHVMLHKQIIDGFFSSHEGIKQLRANDVIQDKEYTEMLEKNIDYLFRKMKEFRLAERILCIFFALLFGYMQISGDDMERARRSRRGGRGRSGRRFDDEWISKTDIEI